MIHRPTPRVALSIGLLAIAPLVGGCVLFEIHEHREVYAGQLDSARDVVLNKFVHVDLLLPPDERYYERLTLLVTSNGFPLQDSVVGQRVSASGGAFEYDGIEGRTDRYGSRVWLVDTADACVIATADLARESSSGVDDPPPAWAEVEGGHVIPLVGEDGW